LSKIGERPKGGEAARPTGDAMAHSYSIDDEVHHQRQGPQLREVAGPRQIYIITRCLPIEGDGRVRYRIKCDDENFERVVSEDELSRLD
jgi:hypothetical protein